MTSDVTAKQYTKNLKNALQVALTQTNLYNGKQGALRLAREYGYCLNDSPYNEAMEEARNSYTTLCVQGYNLNPPVDAKEWYNQVISKIKQ
jgi:chitinase